MASVIEAAITVRELLGEQPVVIGGLAVLARLSTPYRATVDLDILDGRNRPTAHLEVLRHAPGASAEEPSAVVLPTRHHPVRVDVLEARAPRAEHLSDDPGDRLYESSHSWALRTATDVVLQALTGDGTLVEIRARVAEVGPLVAMKLQAVMDRTEAKQGTDLLDVVRLATDRGTAASVLDQIAGVDPQAASDIAHHVFHWFDRRRAETLRLVRSAGGADVTIQDLDLVSQLLSDAALRETRYRP